MSDHLIAEANRHARALIIEQDQIRTELALLREWQREVIQNANAHHAERMDAVSRAERAEAERDQLRVERNNLRADLDAIKAILNEEKARAARAEDNLAALEQCHDDNCRGVVRIADELAVERARLDWLEENAGDIPRYNSRSFIWFANQNLRAAIDAAMKEGTK